MSIEITGAMTIGLWTYFDALGSEYALVSKWQASGNKRAYRIIKTAGNLIRFEISSNGTTTFAVDSAAVVAGQYYCIAARFTPSSELALFVNKVKTTNVTSIPAAINDNTPVDLEFARSDGASYLDGKIMLPYICAYALPDYLVESIYWATQALFGVKDKP